MAVNVHNKSLYIVATVDIFPLLLTISSTSSDSEMSSEIYYIAEVEIEENDESRLSTSQT